MPSAQTKRRVKLIVLLIVTLFGLMEIRGDVPAGIPEEVDDPSVMFDGKWYGRLYTTEYFTIEEVVNGRILESAEPVTFGPPPILAGEIRLKWRINGAEYLGIYKREKSKITISLRLKEFGWPDSFEAKEGQSILVIKPYREYRYPEYR